MLYTIIFIENWKSFYSALLSFERFNLLKKIKTVIIDGLF